MSVKSVPPPLPLPPRKVYYLREVAAMLGLSVSGLTKPGRLDRLYAQGMPRPFAGKGDVLRFPKAAFDAWIEGRTVKAGDAEITPDLARDWQAHLLAVYGDND